MHQNSTSTQFRTDFKFTASNTAPSSGCFPWCNMEFFRTNRSESWIVSMSSRGWWIYSMSTQSHSLSVLMGILQVSIVWDAKIKPCWWMGACKDLYLLYIIIWWTCWIWGHDIYECCAIQIPQSYTCSLEALMYSTWDNIVKQNWTKK